MQIRDFTIHLEKSQNLSKEMDIFVDTQVLFNLWCNVTDHEIININWLIKNEVKRLEFSFMVSFIADS